MWPSRITGSCSDHGSDDVVQHTFVQLYRHWSRVRPESLDAYVRTIVVNTVRSQSRRRRREMTTAEPPDSIAITADPGLQVGLRRALARLRLGRGADALELQRGRRLQAVVVEADT